MLFKKSSLERLQLTTLGHATWKSYQLMQKKAVEQEFTWSGFVISLSIAFLIVSVSASSLNSLYERMVPATNSITHIDQSPQVILIGQNLC